jgi:hypothetical protein
LGSSQSKARAKEAEVQCQATSRTSGPHEGVLEKQKESSESSEDDLGCVVPFDIGIAGFWITTASLVVGVIGIILFFRSIKKPVPSYAVHPLRVRIVDKAQQTIPGLQVLHDGVSLDAQNVTCATLYFWNDGRTTIHQSDVLIPYSIDLDKSAQLLECLTINVTREVCGFRIFRETTGNQSSVNFSIIEPQDGVQVQLIYAGEPNATIEVSGTCEGANEPKRNDKALTASQTYTFFIMLVLVIAVAISFVDFYVPASKHTPAPIRMILALCIMTAPGILTIPAMKWLPGFLARKTAIQKLISKSSAPRPS